MMNVVGHKGRQEVLSLTAVLLKLQVFWNVTMFCWVSGSGCVEDLQFLHLQGPAVQELLDPEDEGDLSKHWQLLTQQNSATFQRI